MGAAQGGVGAAAGGGGQIENRMRNRFYCI